MIVHRFARARVYQAHTKFQRSFGDSIGIYEPSSEESEAIFTRLSENSWFERKRWYGIEQQSHFVVSLLKLSSSLRHAVGCFSVHRVSSDEVFWHHKIQEMSRLWEAHITARHNVRLAIRRMQLPQNLRYDLKFAAVSLGTPLDFQHIILPFRQKQANFNRNQIISEAEYPNNPSAGFSHNIQW